MVGQPTNQRTLLTEGLAQTCRAVLHCRTGHRGGAVDDRRTRAYRALSSSGRASLLVPSSKKACRNGVFPFAECDERPRPVTRQVRGLTQMAQSGSHGPFPSDLAVRPVVFFFGRQVKVSRSVSKVNSGQQGHVRDAEGRSAGLPLTLNIPPCPKKMEKASIKVSTKPQSVNVQCDSLAGLTNHKFNALSSYAVNKKL